MASVEAVTPWIGARLRNGLTLENSWNMSPYAHTCPGCFIRKVFHDYSVKETTFKNLLFILFGFVSKNGN